MVARIGERRREAARCTVIRAVTIARPAKIPGLQLPASRAQRPGDVAFDEFRRSSSHHTCNNVHAPHHPPGLPRSPDAAGHPERPDRMRADRGALEEEKFQTLARETRRWRDSRPSRCAIRWITSTKSRCLAEGRAGPARRRHLDVARHASRRRCARSAAAVQRGRRGDGGAGRERLRRDAPARPSRRDGAADGLLPLQQRRDRGAPRAEAARHRARRHRRFRRASRQRHAGDLLVRPDA